MLTVMILGLVTTAVVIIVAVVMWGARHDTLTESDQESFDRRFDRIAAFEAYSRFPRRSDSPPRAMPQPSPLQHP